MSTYNVGDEDQIEDFTVEMEAELDELLGRYQADREQLNLAELQRMFDLREVKVNYEQSNLLAQINQTQVDANAQADDEDEEDTARGAGAREDNWGIPPSKIKSASTDDKLMSRLEKKMRDMVQREFYSHLDQEHSSSGRDNFVKAPKTGINHMLSRTGESVWKVRTRNMHYGGVQNKTHDLSYCLSVHREISERAGLTSDASIELLKRLLQADPFKLCQNLHRGKSSIDRIYIYLQTTYKDSVSPIKAARLLTEFLDSPNLIAIEKVSNRILELALLAHSEESESMSLKSTATTTITSIYTYLNKYYPRAPVEKIRRIHLQWTQRSNSTEPLDSAFQLIDVSRTQLAGLLPSHANLRKPTGASGQDSKPTTHSHTAPRPYNQHQQPQNQVSTIDNEDLGDLTPEDEIESNEQQFDEIESVDGAKKVYSNDPAHYKENVRCRLCNGNSYVHTPPFHFRCSIYPRMLPSKIQCRTCLGYHQNLGNIPCASPSSKTTQQSTPSRNDPTSQSANQRPAQVFQ